MIEHPWLLVKLLLLIERIPEPAPPAKAARGRPPTYSDRLFLKALLVMILRHLNKVHQLVSVLEELESLSVKFLSWTTSSVESGVSIIGYDNRSCDPSTAMNPARKHYTSDLTDAQWLLIEPLIPPPRPGGNKRTVDMREVVNAILYLNKNGCTWRDLPGEFPPHQTVYDYFRQWRGDGTWKRIYDALHRQYRQSQGREATPSAGSIDSQSVKTTEMGGERGFDGGKKLTGRKRFLLVDTEGFPSAVHVTAASVGEREGAQEMLMEVKDELPRLKKIWVDGGFDGAPFAEWAAEVGGWIIEVVHKIGKGFSVLPRRWVVERTFAWLYKCRRLCRDFERLCETVESFIYVTMIRLLLNRLVSA